MQSSHPQECHNVLGKQVAPASLPLYYETAGWQFELAKLRTKVVGLSADLMDLFETAENGDLAVENF